MMTDEERQKLVAALRGNQTWPNGLIVMMLAAADEIERLAIAERCEISSTFPQALHIQKRDDQTSYCL